MTQEHGEGAPEDEKQRRLKYFFKSIRYDINASGKTQATCEKEKCNYTPRSESKVIPIITVIISALMLIVTGTLAYFTLNLVKDNRRLIDETIGKNRTDSAFTSQAINQTERSFQFTKESAEFNNAQTNASIDLTNKSLDMTRENFAKQNRPYVSLIKMKWMVKPDTITIIGQMMCEGNTQAVNVRMYSMLNLFKDTADVDTIVIGDLIGRKMGDCAPRTITDFLYSDLPSHLKNKNGFLYYYGEIVYYDIFGKKYITYFSYGYDTIESAPDGKVFVGERWNRMR